jgi:hypothetical protein
MISYPLSRKNTLVLAAAGVALIAALCFAAVQNAHAHSAGVTGASSKQTKLDQNTQGESAAVPSSISQTQSVSPGSGNSSSDQGSVTTSDNDGSDGSQPTQSTTHNYSKPGGIEPADGNTPDPDTYKPQPPIVYPGGPIVVPPTDPTHPICHFPQVMPTNGPLPICGNPYPIPPCHPAQPGVMIACPIAYRTE